MVDDVVHTRLVSGVGSIALNRPKALNSLNYAMVERLTAAYGKWSAPGSGVRCIVLQGTGSKAFCAGGDVKAAVLAMQAGRPQDALAFFRSEYHVDDAIARLPMPHIALLDGIVMGGGAGLSMHGTFRVATENSIFAMPELAIGLFPDVGMMHVLTQLPSGLGQYLALSGARLEGQALREAGLATHYVPSALLPQLLQRIQALQARAADPHMVDEVLKDTEQAAGTHESNISPTPLMELLPVISRVFGSGKATSPDAAAAALALEACDAVPAHWVSQTITQLNRGSPLSWAITMEYLDRASHGQWDLRKCLSTDYSLVQHFCAGHGDFEEGVRARLIDKDDQPRWKHASVGQVPADVVSVFFQPLDPLDCLSWDNTEGGITTQSSSRL